MHMLPSWLYKTFMGDFCLILAEVSNFFFKAETSQNKLISNNQTAIEIYICHGSTEILPINLMNTDAKIFAHVICNRI